jgi:glutathione synthase/RimK-type ligase-like ATP-grasp enzyme
MKNATRSIARYLQQFADRNDISLTPMSDNWIFLLEKNGTRHVVFGYDIGLNSSTADRVANDKAATYEILKLSGVPALPHLVYLHPRFAKHVSHDGNWQPIAAKFEEWNRDIVIKPNEGTGGLGVTRARTHFELEFAVQNILTSERSIAISPFTRIETETRVFVLDGAALLAYEKKLPTVVGDGVSTISQLLQKQLNRQTIANVLDDRTSSKFEIDFSQIPASEQAVPIHWKHNLGQGARPELIDLSTAPRVADLAVKAARCIGLRFGAVDLIQTDQGIMVLEINSGVMMETLVEIHPHRDELLERIYGHALSQIFSPTEKTSDPGALSSQTN